jgi:hypothetical protein
MSSRGWPCAAKRSTGGTHYLCHQPPSGQIDLPLGIRNVLFNIDQIRTFIFHRIDAAIRSADRCFGLTELKGALDDSTYLQLQSLDN